MVQIQFPYGKTMLEYSFPEDELVGVLTSAVGEYRPELSGEELVKNAMAAPIGSPSLAALAKGKQNIVIIASDHTRPVPSKVIMPAMLSQIRRGNPDADITTFIKSK